MIWNLLSVKNLTEDEINNIIESIIKDNENIIEEFESDIRSCEVWDKDYSYVQYKADLFNQSEEEFMSKCSKGEDWFQYMESMRYFLIELIKKYPKDKKLAPYLTERIDEWIIRLNKSVDPRKDVWLGIYYILKQKMISINHERRIQKEKFDKELLARTENEVDKTLNDNMDLINRFLEISKKYIVKDDYNLNTLKMEDYDREYDVFRKKATFPSIISTFIKQTDFDSIVRQTILNTFIEKNAIKFFE